MRSKNKLSRDTGKHRSCMLGLKCGQTKMCKILNAVERRRKMDNTSEGNINLMNKKGATKHCSRGLCNMDSKCPERMKEEVLKTEKAKRWLHACGRKDFSRIEQIKKDIYLAYTVLLSPPS